MKGLVGLKLYQVAPLVHVVANAAAPEDSVEQVDPKALSQQDPLRPLRNPTTHTFLIGDLWTAIGTRRQMFSGWIPKGS